MVEGASDLVEKKGLAQAASPQGLGGDLLSKPGTVAGSQDRPAVPEIQIGGKLNISDGDLYKSTLKPTDKVAQAPVSADSQLPFFNKGVSPELASTIQTAIDQLPPKVRQQLHDQGAQVYAFKDIREYDKFFGTHKSEEVVDGHRLAAEDAVSLNDTNAHPPRIAIFERTMKGDQINKFEDAAGLTRHELGHIVTNKLIPPPDASGPWDRELALRVGTEAKTVPIALRNGVLQHYFHAGPAEIYAETFAMSIGGGSNKTEDALLQKYFPQTLAYLRNAYAK